MSLAPRTGTLALLLLLLTGAWYLTRSPRRDTPESALTAPTDTPSAPDPASFRPLPLLDPPELESRTSLTADEADSEAPPRGPLRGLLLDEETRFPLGDERIVLLASPDNRAAETLRSGEDGRFTSTIAFPAGPVRAWVKMPGTGALLVRHEAEFDPTAAGPWRILVPPRPAPRSTPELTAVDETTLSGLIIDLGGRPVIGAQVKAIPLTPEGALGFADSQADGGFLLHDLAPGPHRVLVQGRFGASAPLDLVLTAGPNSAGSILLPVAASAGSVRGRLLAEIEEGVDDPFGFLVLHDPERGKERAVPADWSLFSSEEDGVTTFELQDVAAGTYELEFVPLDGRAYEPSVLRVSPPSEGLEFRALGPAQPGCVLVVREAATGELLERFVLFGRVHGQWLGGEDEGEEELPPWCDRWLVYAEGHRPARGDLTGVRVVRGEDGNERRELEVELQRGYGLALLFKDLESDRLLVPESEGWLGAGLADVEVLAGSETVARSDADGLAVLDLARPPEDPELRFHRPGWRVAGESGEHEMRLIHMLRE